MTFCFFRLHQEYLFLGSISKGLQEVNHAIERKLRDINGAFQNPLDSDRRTLNLDFEINHLLFFASRIGL